jgi:START domain
MRTVIIGTALLLLAACAAEAAAPKWKHILREDGISVSTREVAGRSFPSFRGIGVVHANIFEVLAVLSDIKRYTEWQGSCAEARLLRKISEREYIVYSRTDAPWPVSDRDTVNRSKVHVDLKRRIVNIKFRAIKTRLQGPVSGVVRMNKLRGHFKLTSLARNKTKVDYKVDADPEGMLPTWLAKIATKKLPLETIQKLRKQVKHTRGWYSKRIKRWLGEAKKLAAKSPETSEAKEIMGAKID